MRRITKLTVYQCLAIFILTIATMSFRGPNMDSQVECGGKISDGYYRINVFNIKRGIKYKFKNAAKDAVHAFLFRGWPSALNCLEHKPLINTPDEKKLFDEKCAGFFSKEFLLYVNSASEHPVTVQQKGSVQCKVYTLNIAGDNLRKFLEEKGVIRKLNTGF